MIQPKILITGAGGFTGRHACRYFSEMGYEVIPVVRTKASDLDSKFAAVPCDLTEKIGVMNLIRFFKPDFCLHLAGQNAVDQSWKNPITAIETNVMSTLYLLEAIRQSKVPSKIVIVGSALEADLAKRNSPPHPYSLSKTMQSLLCRSWVDLFKMDIVIAKPANLIGPGHSNGICSIIARQIAAMVHGDQEKVIEVNNLSARRDFLDVRDTVKAYHLLFERGHSDSIYNIATGETHSLEELIQVFQNLLSFELSVFSKNPLPEKTPFPIDTSAIKELGWKPNIPFHQTIEEVLAFHLSLYKQ